MKFNKRTIVAGSLTLALAGAGMAFAVFNPGADTTATTGGSYLSVTAPTPAVADLLPNEDNTFDATITNADTTNDHDVDSLNVSVENPDGSPWSVQADPSKPACTANDFDVWTDDPATVPAGGSVDVTVHVVLSERSWDQRNCLNLSSVPFHLTVS
jgi:hypothetical protein